MMILKLIDSLSSFTMDEWKDIASSFCKMKFGLCANIQIGAVNSEVLFHGSKKMRTRTVYEYCKFDLDWLTGP
jgi:hypothetical protein